MAVIFRVLVDLVNCEVTCALCAYVDAGVESLLKRRGYWACYCVSLILRGPAG